MSDKSPILITGCARSGTSMTAGIIDLCGVWGGYMYGANENNKKGMFENRDIREEVMKPYLNQIEADPMGQKPLPDQEKVQYCPGLRDKVLGKLRGQGLKPDQRWFYKGAKMTLVWYPWARAFPEAKWLIVRRPDDQIVDSCLRTSFMRKRKTRDEWEDWIDYHKDRWEEMKAKLNVREIWSNKIIKGDYTELREVLDWLGLEYDMGRILAFVDPMLYNRGKN